MRKNFMIAVLCMSIFSCSKELPTGTTNVKGPVPFPWEASSVTATGAGNSGERQTDCNNAPANSTQSYCNDHHIGYPVTGCAGGGSDTGVFCCRLTPPVTPPVTPPER
jgi:hypothetical protein